MKILIIDGCFGNTSELYVLIGIILMILMVVLVIRQKKRDSALKEKSKEIIENDNLYVEKDVLMMDKPFINVNEPGYKPADKSKFAIILFIVLFLIGLFLFIIGTYQKNYSSDDITGPDKAQFNQTKKLIEN